MYLPKRYASAECSGSIPDAPLCAIFRRFIEELHPEVMNMIHNINRNRLMNAIICANEKYGRCF